MSKSRDYEARQRKINQRRAQERRNHLKKQRNEAIAGFRKPKPSTSGFGLVIFLVLIMMILAMVMAGKDNCATHNKNAVTQCPVVDTKP